MDIQRSMVLIIQTVTFNVPIFILLVFLILMSAFFSMSETAISCASQVRLKLFIEERRNGSKKAMYCSEHFEKTLTTILVGNNIVNTATATLALGFFTGIFGPIGPIEWISTLITTIVLLIFGEILPKTIAKNYADSIALKVSWIIYYLSFILYPVVFLFMRLQRLFMKKEKEAVNETELEAILDTMEDQGSIEENEVSIIKNVFELNDRPVMDIMVPRIEMFAIDIESTNEEIREMLLENQFSRIPVFEEDKDHIIGILYERDFFVAYIKDNNFNVRSILRPVLYVSSSMKVDDLIKKMQKEKSHLAIVSGEYGDTLGLVTMEDALEELVGEIYDEYDDADEKEFKVLEDGSLEVSGDMYVSTLFEELDIPDEPKNVPNKVGSWLYDSLEQLPSVGASIDYIATYTKQDENGDYVDYQKKITMSVSKVDGRRIDKVHVCVCDATDEEVLEKEKNEEE